MNSNEFKAPLSKARFIDVIQDLKRNDKFVDALNDVFDEYESETRIWSTSLDTTIVTLLEEIFQDKDEWISYWLWELNYGENYDDHYVVDIDNNPIPLKTVEDLYDLLIANIKESNNNADNS